MLKSVGFFFFVLGCTLSSKRKPPSNPNACTLSKEQKAALKKLNDIRKAVDLLPVLMPKDAHKFLVTNVFVDAYAKTVSAIKSKWGEEAGDRLNELGVTIGDLMEGLCFYHYGDEEAGVGGFDDKFCAWMFTWFPPAEFLQDKDEMTYKKEFAEDMIKIFRLEGCKRACAEFQHYRVVQEFTEQGQLHLHMISHTIHAQSGRTYNTSKYQLVSYLQDIKKNVDVRGYNTYAIPVRYVSLPSRKKPLNKIDPNPYDSPKHPELHKALQIHSQSFSTLQKKAKLLIEIAESQPTSAAETDAAEIAGRRSRLAYQTFYIFFQINHVFHCVNYFLG